MACSQVCHGSWPTISYLNKGGSLSITVMTLQRQATAYADVVDYVRKGNILSIYGIKGPKGGSFLGIVRQLKRRSREAPIPCQIWVGATPVPAQERAWLAAMLTAMQHGHDCPQRYVLGGLITIANTVNSLPIPFTCTFDNSVSLGVIWPGRQ